MALDIARAALGWTGIFVRHHWVVILSPRIFDAAVLERISVRAIPQGSRLSRDKAAGAEVLTCCWLSALLACARLTI